MNDLRNWQGDLDDDCALRDGDYSAVAEDMGDEWHVAVYRNGKQIFHDVDDNIHPLTGPAARRLCELVIDAERWRGRLL